MSQWVSPCWHRSSVTICRFVKRDGPSLKDSTALSVQTVEVTNQVENEVRMPTFITLPGIGGSGEGHWQTLWERSHSSMRRFKPPDWDRPQLSEGVGALQEAVDAAAPPIIFVADSLSCLLVTHWAGQCASTVAGAFLVAVPDPNTPLFPSAANSFRAVPGGVLSSPSIIIASTDDSYSNLEYAQSPTMEGKADKHRGVRAHQCIQ
jgi:predicted alpha/beta hydrolase family esterase